MRASETGLASRAQCHFRSPGSDRESAQRQQIGSRSWWLGGVWLLLVNELRTEWSLNQQYSYGWVVPILCTLPFLGALEGCASAWQICFGLFPHAASVAICAFSIFPLRLFWRRTPIGDSRIGASPSRLLDCVKRLCSIVVDGNGHGTSASLSLFS